MPKRLETRRRLLRAGALALPGFALKPAAAVEPASAVLPEALRARGPGWLLSGRGEAHFFGLRLYAASLWVAGPAWREDAPFALALDYARDFSRSLLVGTSLDEMRRLGGADEARLARWKRLLEDVLPDVKTGESLVGVSLPGRGAFFHHQGRPCGEVAEPAFARAFFAIWLDPRCQLPALRRRLLGGAP